ncbi:iron ABC transporter permease [Starkeya sp. ORNL1]|uniref:ABC transporter permease n=1 Tax=Starkeya sp. ORNL1 TaxID=2709380 RepID=UPI001463ED0D|nr:iron ABC transporter permease [Starkeya sp. ORNL1]QJP16125.1 iron ABC transporter permease [Starkeya sp. ORNL1]
MPNRFRWNSADNAFRSSGSIVWFTIAAALLLLVVNPLWQLFSISFSDPTSGGWTLENYIEAFSRARYLRAFLNSLMLGIIVAALCVAFGVPIAWAVSRTDMPAKGIVRTLVLAAFITPPFLGATSWILLAGPNAGWLNRAYIALTGAETGIFNIYSLTGLAFVIALYSFPYVFVFTSAALDVVSSEMEDAANIMGANRWRTTFKVTLPLVLPAILSAVIITFLEAVSIISSTIMVALPARINLIPLQLYQFFGYPLRLEVAAAYAMPLLLVTIGLFALQKVLLGRKGYVTMTGKGGERRPIELGLYKWLALGYSLLVLSLAVILPYMVLLQAALSKAWARGIGTDNLTLVNFRYLLFENAHAPRSILNTFVYSAASATIAVGLALAIAYIVSRKLLPFANVLSVAALTPFVIPGLVLAIGFYAAYAPPPFALAGTGAILILAFTTRFLPVAYANTSAAIGGVNRELEDAVRILGGSRFLAIRRVMTPLLKKSLMGAWLLVFIISAREVSTALFLYGPDTRTMSVLFFDLTEGGRFEQLCALGIILLLTVLVFVIAGQLLIGRDFMLRRGR